MVEAQRTDSAYRAAMASSARPSLLADLLTATPVAGFKAADESEGKAGTALSAGERQFHVIADGEGLQDAVEGRLQEDIEQGEHAEEVELGRILRESGRDALAEAGAGEDHGSDGGGALSAGGAGHGNGNHAAESIFANHEQGFVNGGDDAGMGLQGRVREPEHTIAEGGIGGDDLFEFTQVGGAALELGKQVEINEVVRRKGPGLHQDGLGKEIALKEGAALGFRDAQLSVGFDFFGHEPGLGAGGQGVDRAAGEKVGGHEVNLDKVGEREEGSARGSRQKTVERETVAFGLEREAAVDHLGIGIDVFEDFNHGRLRGEQSNEAVDQGRARAVDEGGGGILIGNEHQPVVDDLRVACSRSPEKWSALPAR